MTFETPSPQTIRLLGVPIHVQPLEALLQEIQAAACGDRRLMIAHVNITGLNLAYEQGWLRRFYNAADRVFCDGMGVRLGARLLGQPAPPRYTLADWSWLLAERAAASGFSLYLLGNPPGVAERAAANLGRRCPGLHIAGVQHGYFDQTPGSVENEAVLTQINATRPGVLLVGMGMPVQERWLLENWERLDVRVAITCGALFEYLSGDLRRGPQWMTQNYLEWLARLLISPRRYAWRYLRDIPLFFGRILLKGRG